MILRKIITAVKDYGELPETLQGPVEEALATLEKDLDTGGYEQSSAADRAEKALEDAMNEVDASAEDEEVVE